MGALEMAGDSYSLDEVSSLLGVPVADLVRKIEEGAFPGRFLTSSWEMRIPVRDVRRAVEQMRAASGPRALVRTSRPDTDDASSALVDPQALRATLDAWWDERESRLVHEIQQVLRQDDERWALVESVLSEVRDRLDRLDAAERTAAPLEVSIEAWSSAIDDATGAPVQSIFAELRDLEQMLGIEDGRAPAALPADDD